MSGRGAERILEFIEWLARRHQPTTLAEITHAMAVPKSSALLLLCTLVEMNYVSREPDGLYVLTRLPGEPSAGERTWGTILRTLDPVLREAVSEARESCFVAVLDGDQVRYISKLLPEREIRYDRDIGKLRTAHTVASGIVLLCGLPPTDLEVYLGPLPADTRRHVVGDIDAARREGVFVNLNGVVEGAAGIAAPVIARDGSTVAAINIAGPRERIAQDQERIKALTMATAAHASHELAKRFAVSGEKISKKTREK